MLIKKIYYFDNQCLTPNTKYFDNQYIDNISKLTNILRRFFLQKNKPHICNFHITYEITEIYVILCKSNMVIVQLKCTIHSSNYCH